MNIENVGYFAIGQVGNVIVILACLIAMVIAIVRYRKLGMAGIFAMLGFAIMLVQSLVSVGYATYVTFLMDRGGMESLRTIATIISIVHAILGPASIVALILAVFLKRPSEAPSNNVS